MSPLSQKFIRAICFFWVFFLLSVQYILLSKIEPGATIIVTHPYHAVTMVCNIYVSAYDGVKFVLTVTNVPGVSMYGLCIFVCFCDNKEFSILIFYAASNNEKPATHNK